MRSSFKVGMLVIANVNIWMPKNIGGSSFFTWWDREIGVVVEITDNEYIILVGENKGIFYKDSQENHRGWVTPI